MWVMTGCGGQRKKPLNSKRIPTMARRAQDSDLALIGYGIGTWTPRRATDQESADYADQHKPEAWMAPTAAQIAKARADKARLDSLTR